MAGQQYYYKIVLLGDIGVGKTSLFNRIKTDRFVQVSATIGQGADQYTYTTTIGDDSLNVSYSVYCVRFNFTATHKTNAVMRI